VWLWLVYYNAEMNPYVYIETTEGALCASYLPARSTRLILLTVSQGRSDE